METIAILIVSLSTSEHEISLVSFQQCFIVFYVCLCTLFVRFFFNAVVNEIFS